MPRTNKKEDALVEEVAIKALAASTDNPLLARGATRLARAVATREARAAIQAAVRPFYKDETPPARPASPLALSTYFEIPRDQAVCPTPRPNAPFPHTTQERQKYAREFFAHAFKESRTTLADLTQARIRVFYRLARELARHTGALMDDQSLSDLTWEAWTKPLRARELHGARTRTSKVLRDGPDLALLPPPAPNPLPDDYDPLKDEALVHYCAALESIAEDLHVQNGTETEPYLGRYGLKGLLEPETVRLACPSPAEVLEWEHQLVQDTLQVFLARGTSGAYAWLKQEHGVRTHEARPLLRAASAEALQRTEGDVEEKRAAMQLRLEDIARRARRAMNLSAELSASKLQALIGGFARVEPENATTEFINVVRKVNGEPDHKEIAMDEDDENKESA